MKRRSGFLTRSLGLLLPLSVASLSIPTSSLAAVIPIAGIEGFQQGDTPPGGNGSVTRTIDGSGMAMPDADDPSGWTTVGSAWEDDWQGNGTNFDDATANWAVIDLGAAQPDLKTMYLWNVNEANHSARGMRYFEIYWAASPTVAPPVTGEIAQSYEFTSGGWSSLGMAELARGTELAGMAPAAFDVAAAAGARYIGIRMLSVWAPDGDRVGFAEVAFTDTVDGSAISPADPGGEVVPVAAVFGFHQGDNPSPGNGSISRVFDGSITVANPFDPLTWTHGNGWPEDWQGDEAPGTTENGTWIVFDLGESVSNLATMHLWNVNESPWPSRGVNEFQIHYAATPTLTPPAAGATPTAYDFASGGWTAFGETQTLAQASGLAGEAVNGSFDLGGMPPTRYVGLEILSNHGAGDRVGLAHVAFQTGVATAPAAFVITDIEYDVDGGEVSITWNSESGVTYGIEASTTLTPNGMPGGWEEIDDLTATGPSSTYEHAPVAPEMLPENLSYRIRDLSN